LACSTYLEWLESIIPQNAVTIDAAREEHADALTKCETGYEAFVRFENCEWLIFCASGTPRPYIWVLSPNKHDAPSLVKAHSRNGGLVCRRYLMYYLHCHFERLQEPNSFNDDQAARSFGQRIPSVTCHWRMKSCHVQGFGDCLLVNELQIIEAPYNISESVIMLLLKGVAGHFAKALQGALWTKQLVRAVNRQPSSSHLQKTLM
jgi:hypothetical protein